MVLSPGPVIDILLCYVKVSFTKNKGFKPLIYTGEEGFFKRSESQLGNFIG